ncbi:DUF1601 domain-containing protein [Thalassotalea sp. G20_0]|uniref:RAP domain-containing protein n=1 Tax=Thalassotalea sp. G20_0 TaxID=2821093 RepID=UPI001ADB4FA3|nr:RAP domain-containing protein [Thalassotalea sp. G20_0]MBO9495659.1 DUF1601 domain-containing protein [Thalassotalea sp. G20_0]
MDRSYAGITGQYTRSGNDNNQPKDHAASSRRGRYRHAPVRQWCHPPRTAPGRNESYYSSAACSFQHLQRRSVNRTQDFNNLIKQEIMDGLVNQSDRIGHRYDGKHHGQYASSIKKYTSAAKRPLNRTEQSHLICFLQNFTATPSWNWRSLTTTFHSFTSAGVFTPYNPMDERVKRTQAALLSTLLDAIIFKCNQKPQAMNIDPRGVVNLLWAMAKLVDNGLEQTPEFNGAVAALLPQVNAQKNYFIPQHIVNLLWAMAKLADYGQEQTPEFNGAVAALLPRVNVQKANFTAQGIANLLWAMAKLVDNGQEQAPGFKEALTALLPYVNRQKGQFTPQHIANLLWAIAKLVGNGQEQTPALNEAVAALLPLVTAQKKQFIPQHIANLLWAIAKLVDNGQGRTPVLNGAVAALLPHVNAQKANFTGQGVTNLLWAMAKLVNGQKWAPGLKEAVATLLPCVNVQKAHFKPQEIANLLWAMVKLVDNGQERTPEFNEAVVALLPRVKAHKDRFNAQPSANLLWAMAKLVENGQQWTPGLKEAVTALLPHVKAQKACFKPQEVSNLLWAMAKLVDNGQKLTAKLKEAVAALLPYVNAQKDQFTPQHIANLLWAMVKLVDNGQEQTPEFNAAVAALLPYVNAHKANFQPQEIANLFWVIAKLSDNNQERTPELKEAVAALLPHVNAQQAHFQPQEIANLLWAVAKLGELVELNVVTSTFESLVYRISENPQLSQQTILMSLWGVMAGCARLSLASNSNKNNCLEEHINDLFSRLEDTSPDNAEEQSILAMATSWLGRACPLVPHYPTIISKPQTVVCNQLQSCIPSLRIEEEKSLNSLPPVDLLLPDHNLVIEVQGPSHYVGGDFTTRNGSTLLKIALLQKAGFEVIEIPVNRLLSQDLMKPYIDQIKTRIGFPPPGHGSVSLKRRWADEAYVTADKGRQPSDHGYLTAAEHSEEQTGKPAKRKKTNNQ